MTYKVIIRDRETGVEEYIDGLTKAASQKEAEARSGDCDKLVYVSWEDKRGRNGYLNREGSTTDCPGEPW